MAAPGFLDSLSPWTSKSATPKPVGDLPPPQLGQWQGADHRVDHRTRFGPRDYPEDCPMLNTRWFYAVDVPKRKPLTFEKATPDQTAKPPLAPKKYAPFPTRDSRSIEAAFQKISEQQHSIAGRSTSSRAGINESSRSREESGDIASQPNTSLDDNGQQKNESVKVPVNEDFLFDVNIGERELAPAYWLGPVYDVRRGTWFYQDGASSRPCDENLASQLEEGYVKAEPWRNEVPAVQRSSSKSQARQPSVKRGDDVAKLGATGIKPPVKTLVDEDTSIKEEVSSISATKFQLKTHRLFGAHMSSVVTYQDADTAWILTDDFLSRMSSTVYQRFAGGGHLGGVKVVRGFTGDNVVKDAKTPTGVEDRGRSLLKSKRRSAPPGSTASIDRVMNVDVSKAQETFRPESTQSALERRMATIVGSPGVEDSARQEDEARKREESEIQEDYKNTDGEDQGREIEHLLLVTHGIGQRLGLRMESLNFIHDVNVLRKTLKSVYTASPDLQALNSEVDKLPKNCRVQVLPIIWRHLLDFPKQRAKKTRPEQDIGDVDDFADDVDYPSLGDITVEGVPAIRNLVEDLFLDILLYQSKYGDLIAEIVQKECNRVYKLFLERNPLFRGKISLVGHSMGSLVMFDLLCRQKDSKPIARPARTQSNRKHVNLKAPDQVPALHLDFDVEDLYCLGSPIGLFQMIQGRKILGRKTLASSSETSTDGHKDSFFYSNTASGSSKEDATGSIEVSSPKCAQMYNIFHPCDPISYRVEPLISPAMKALKPQPLPYIKRGIFGAPGLSNIGVRVGQSVSGLWSNITTGVASSLLNRSLGLNNDSQFTATQTRAPLSMGAALAPSIGSKLESEGNGSGNEKKNPSDPTLPEINAEHPATLIDSEIETLYAGFQKRRKTVTTDQARDFRESAEYQQAEDRARQLRREEAKVRALNSTGRVDFSIQEGVFDISLIASLASHLSYWTDEDVSHFMVSQLLSRQRAVEH